MSIEFSLTFLIAASVLAAAATAALEQHRSKILIVVVDVLPALGYGIHHQSFGFRFGFRRILIILSIWSTCGRDWVDLANQRVIKLELLVAAHHQEEEAPEDAAKTADQTEDNV